MAAKNSKTAATEGVGREQALENALKQIEKTYGVMGRAKPAT